MGRRESAAAKIAAALQLLQDAAGDTAAGGFPSLAQEIQGRAHQLDAYRRVVAGGPDLNPAAAAAPRDQLAGHAAAAAAG